MVHRIRSAVGYHGNELGRYDELSGWDSEAFLQHASNPNFWKLANVRYLYTNGSRPMLEGMRLVAGPAKNAAGNATYVFEFPGENPPAWVTPLAVKAADDNVLATVLDPRFDVRRVALFDTAAAVTAQPVPQQLPEALDLTARFTRFAPGRISVALSRPAPAGAALVVSENFYPGWSATVDGRPTPVGRADYVLMGVVLPAGARQVELTFDSPRYHTGKAITLACLTLSLVAAGAGLVMERGRRG
jgi:hypothetical protein